MALNRSVVLSLVIGLGSGRENFGPYDSISLTSAGIATLASMAVKALLLNLSLRTSRQRANAALFKYAGLELSVSR